jgi:tetratricopeptide (TPR) repeat protein
MKVQTIPVSVPRRAVLIALVLLWAAAAAGATRELAYRVLIQERATVAAVRVWPENAAGWRSLADSDLSAGNASAALIAARRALSDDAANWRNWIELEQVQASSGDFSTAMKTIEPIVRQQRSYDLYLDYADLLAVEGDLPGYWRNATIALTYAPSARIPELLHQAAGFSPDLAGVQALVTNAESSVGGDQRFHIAFAYWDFLLNQNALDRAFDAWQTVRDLVPNRGSSPVSYAITSRAEQQIQALAVAGNSKQALAIWHDGLRLGMFDARLGPAPDNLVANGNFAAPLENSPLNWWRCSDCSVWIERGQGSRSPFLRMDFQLGVPENVTVLLEYLLLDPHRTYRLDYSSRRDGAGNETGIYVDVIRIADNGVLARVAAPLSQSWQPAEGRFTTPAQPVGCELRVAYERPPGQVQFSDSFLLRNVRISSVP